MDGEIVPDQDQIDPRLAGAAAIEGQGGVEPGSLVTPTPTDEPQETRIKPITVVDDIHKAETMAYAGDDYRSKAADIRKSASEEAELDEKIEQYENENYARAKTGLISRRQRRDPDQHREMDGAYKARVALRRKRHALDEQYGEDFIDFPRAPFELTDPIEKNYDRVASQVEDWAGVLHKHPLTDTFREAHPDLDEITPMSLVRMEAELRHLKSEGLRPLAQSHAMSSDVLRIIQRPTVAYNTRLESQYQMAKLKEMLEHASEERVAEWYQLQTTLFEALQAIDKFCDEVGEEVVYRPRREQIASLQKVLDDVRTGMGASAEPNGDQPNGGAGQETHDGTPAGSSDDQPAPAPEQQTES